MHSPIRVTITADPLKDEDSTWTIFIYGGNPMIEDEEMPFSMNDPVFDEILSDMMVHQVLGKHFRVDIMLHAYLYNLAQQRPGMHRRSGSETRR